jgi:hypothetical protein
LCWNYLSDDYWIVYLLHLNQFWLSSSLELVISIYRTLFHDFWTQNPTFLKTTKREPLQPQKNKCMIILCIFATFSSSVNNCWLIIAHLNITTTPHKDGMFHDLNIMFYRKIQFIACSTMETNKKCNHIISPQNHQQ